MCVLSQHDVKGVNVSHCYTFSEAEVRLRSAYMEDLDICEQVRIAHESDVIIGVHGAGLVHSWWMRKGAILMELVPRDKINRPMQLTESLQT